MSAAVIETLEWDWGHMTFERSQGGMTGRLFPHMNGDPEEYSIPFAIHEDLSFEEIKASWERQRKRWLELKTPSECTLNDLRVIWLPKGYCILWFALSVHTIRHDICIVVALTEAQWRQYGAHVFDMK